MRRTTISAAIAASFGALLFSGAVVAAPRAEAAPSDCLDGTACVFGDSNYEGRFIRYSGTVSVPNIGNFMNDLTTSAWNRTGQPVCFYDGIDYDDFLFVLRPGESTGNVGEGDNDRISSLRNCSGVDENGQPASSGLATLAG